MKYAMWLGGYLIAVTILLVAISRLKAWRRRTFISKWAKELEETHDQYS
jgi:hypothetical protein